MKTRPGDVGEGSQQQCGQARLLETPLEEGAGSIVRPAGGERQVGAIIPGVEMRLEGVDHAMLDGGAHHDPGLPRLPSASLKE